LQHFFRYLFQAGRITTNLALSIPSVAQRYGTRLPRHQMPRRVPFQHGYLLSDGEDFEGGIASTAQEDSMTRRKEGMMLGARIHPY